MKAEAGVTGMRRMSFAYGREQSLPLVFRSKSPMENKTKEISVFVDESGSFQPDEKSSRYYIVCFVFHDQSCDISPWTASLESYLENIGLGPQHCIHVGPLVRREAEYANMPRETRQAIFRRMMAFVRKADISYKCFRLDKHFDNRDCAVHDKLLQDITRFLVAQADGINTYDKLKVYYDNGQTQLKDLLLEAFAMFSSKTEFVPDVHPNAYRLFQAADLFCTLELAALKIEAGEMSTSEKRFFGDVREFRRNILKQLRQKLVK